MQDYDALAAFDESAEIFLPTSVRSREKSYMISTSRGDAGLRRHQEQSNRPSESRTTKHAGPFHRLESGRLSTRMLAIVGDAGHVRIRGAAELVHQASPVFLTTHYGWVG